VVKLVVSFLVFSFWLLVPMYRDLLKAVDMQCQICNNNEATIHLTEISGSVRTELHLCEYCAAQQGIAVAKSSIPINELLSGLLAAAPQSEESSGVSEKELTCPRCGFTLDQLRNEALMGCPYDYEVFEKFLMPLIENTHNGKSIHCGKVPSKAPKDTKKQIELLTLKEQLRLAVGSEDYELAAKLRDKIADWEKNCK
jgi:protein arginine kinase activator